MCLVRQRRRGILWTEKHNKIAENIEIIAKAFFSYIEAIREELHNEFPNFDNISADEVKKLIDETMVQAGLVDASAVNEKGKVLWNIAVDWHQGITKLFQLIKQQYHIELDGYELTISLEQLLERCKELLDSFSTQKIGVFCNSYLCIYLSKKVTFSGLILIA